MNPDENEAVILSAVRTPSGRFQGSLSTIPAPRLGAIVVKAAVERAGISHPSEIDEVLMGNVVSAGLGQNPARQAALFAGLPESVGATTINKVCGSGLKAVMLAAQAIRAGDGDLFVAGGMESMSRAPFLVDGRTGTLRFGHAQFTMDCGTPSRIGGWATPPSSSPRNMKSRARQWMNSPSPATAKPSLP